MSTGIRRILAMSLATALMLAVVWLVTSYDQAQGQTADTCKDVGFQNLTTSTTGPWGSISFDPDEPVLELTVAAGYEVRLCIKAGSAQQGLGPEVSDWLDEGVYEMTHSSGKDLSHYGLLYRQTTTTTTQSDEETTSTNVTTTTAPEESSTTTTIPSETTTTTEPESRPAPTTTVPGPSSTASDGEGTRPLQPEDGTRSLPFTGVADWLAPIAAVLVSAGLAALSIAGRKEADSD